MLTLDPTDDFQARAAERLRTESTAWIITTGADGTPQPNPIWFVWDGADKVLIYSVEAAKTRHISQRPRVSFVFNTDSHGDDVVIFSGTAEIDRTQPRTADNPAFLEKYAEGIPAIGLTPESYSERYSAPIVVTLEKVRGF